MVTMTPKLQVHQLMTATCPSHARSDVEVRGLESVIDEPTERGGTNLGFTPTETLMAALVGCTNVISNKLAHKYGVDMRDMTIDLDATFDRRGSTLTEEIDVPFPHMKLTVNVATSAPPSEMQKVIDELPKFCPVAKVIRQSGTEIEEVWNVTYL